MCGYLRISLLTNSFKRPLPLLSISLKGFALLEQFKILIESREEFIKLNKELEVYLIKNNNEIEEEEEEGDEGEELSIKLTNNLDLLDNYFVMSSHC